MTDETNLILHAMHSPRPAIKVNSYPVTPEIDPSPLLDHDPIIANITKKNKKSAVKRKPMSRWDGYDFFKYLKDNISVHGIQIIPSRVRASELIRQSYDIFVTKMGSIMTNEIFKSYLDWWMSSYGYLLHGQVIYAGLLKDDLYIDKFLTRYSQNYTEQIQDKKVEQTSSLKIDDDTIYKQGGTHMLIMSRGLVIAYNVIIKFVSKATAMNDMKKFMRNITKDAAKEIMDKTIQSAPYDRHLTIDFISIVRPSLVFHGLQKYISLNYSTFFKK